MQTVKEVAAELGVTPQTIRNVIAKQNILPKQGKTKHAFLLSEDDVTLIKSALSEKSENKRKTKTTQKQNKNDTLLLLLQNELEAKNKQSEMLQEENARLTDTLAKTAESLQAAQALHAATVKGQIEQKEDPAKRKWWKFWK